MREYKSLNIPDSCKSGNTIFKKSFYENANLTTSDKKLFTDSINKITWVYSLKPETININPFKDDVRDYPEIEVIEVELLEDNGLKRIAEIVMKTIPYPMVIIFRLKDKIQFYVAHQRINQNDITKNTLEEIISTEWMGEDSPLLSKLDISKVRFTNYFTLYSDIVDAISIYNVSNMADVDIEISGEEARLFMSKIESLDKQISVLRYKSKKETQFNRNTEINIEINKLKNLKESMIGGNLK